MTNRGNLALIDSWVLSLHSKSPRTVDLYVREVTRFADWLEAEDRTDDLLRVARRDAEAYIGHMRDQGRAPATIRSRWIALRSFYGWTVEEEELDASPMAKVKVPKTEPPAPETVGADDLRLLLKACEGRSFEDRRDMALLRFMVATGLRASEVCDLATDDIDLRSRVAHVRHGKGDRARLVRFDPGTAAALDRYKRARARHRLAASPRFWLGWRGPLTRKGLGPILNKRCAEAGIAHVNPHRLRHTFADRFLSAGGNEGDLQRLGGWENSDVMRRYGAARATDRALEAYDTVSPLGDL
jgi:site-specific recombinase XerD